MPADFAHQCFLLPHPAGAVANVAAPSMEDHIRALWPLLTRSPDTADAQSSLIPLPHPYIVPGGRFREVYYWDSYFTMLGLIQSGRTDLVRDMLDNFSYLIAPVGHIPNGGDQVREIVGHVPPQIGPAALDQAQHGEVRIP